MFLKVYPLEAKTAPKNWNKSVHISWARLTSCCHLGLISDPLIVSKFHNKTHDPKGQENKIYTIVKTDILLVFICVSNCLQKAIGRRQNDPLARKEI